MIRPWARRDYANVTFGMRTAASTAAGIQSRGMLTAPIRSVCSVVICTSSSTKPRSRSRSTSATSATFDASVTRWNIDSPANNPPTATP